VVTSLPSGVNSVRRLVACGWMLVTRRLWSLVVAIALGVQVLSCRPHVDRTLPVSIDTIFISIISITIVVIVFRLLSQVSTTDHSRPIIKCNLVRMLSKKYNVHWLAACVNKLYIFNKIWQKKGMKEINNNSNRLSYATESASRANLLIQYDVI